MKKKKLSSVDGNGVSSRLQVVESAVESSGTFFGALRISTDAVTNSNAVYLILMSLSYS